MKATVPGHADRYERIRRRRYLRHWTHPEGAVRLEALLPPDDGARLLAAVDARREPIFAEARRAGRHERYEAYAADALVSLADGAGAPKATVHVRADYDALVRGHAYDGETCDIPGVGPIPVAVARRLSADAFLKIILTKGVDVLAVAHGGRTVPAHLRTALEARDPTCVVPGCDGRDRLEMDHVVPVIDGANLARLCRWHHMLKSHHGYRLSGRPGEWTWRPPDHAPP